MSAKVVYAGRVDQAGVVRPFGGGLRWHIVYDPDKPVWYSACAQHELKRTAVPVPAGKVPAVERCMRPGCRGRWPTGGAERGR